MGLGIHWVRSQKCNSKKLNSKFHFVIHENVAYDMAAILFWSILYSLLTEVTAIHRRPAP